MGKSDISYRLKYQRGTTILKDVLDSEVEEQNNFIYVRGLSLPKKNLMYYHRKRIEEESENDLLKLQRTMPVTDFFRLFVGEERNRKSDVFWDFHMTMALDLLKRMESLLVSFWKETMDGCGASNSEANHCLLEGIKDHVFFKSGSDLSFVLKEYVNYKTSDVGTKINPIYFSSAFSRMVMKYWSIDEYRKKIRDFVTVIN